MEGASSEISHPSTRRQKFNGTLSATRDDEKYRHANDLCGDYVLKTDVPIITYFDNLLFRFATQKLPVNACERLAKLSLRFSKLKLTSPHARRLLATMDFVLAYEAIKTQLQPRGELARRQAALMQMKNLGLEPDPKLLAVYCRKLKAVEALWPKVFAAQKARLDTVGDFGNLANINLKAWQAWIKFKNAI